MGRTGELTRAALYARGDVLLLALFPVLKGRQLDQQIRLQAHRTSTNTLGTTDTGLRLLTASFIIADDSYRVGSLTDWHLYRSTYLQGN